MQTLQEELKKYKDKIDKDFIDSINKHIEANESKGRAESEKIALNKVIDEMETEKKRIIKESK